MTATETPLPPALHRLVTAGTLRPDQAAAVVHALAQDRQPARGRLPELLGYVGGALTAGAVLVLVGTAWDDLGQGLRTGLLVLTAAALALGALGVAAPREETSARRRLASLLLTLAAAALAGATAVAVPHDGALLAGIVGTAAASAGYLLCRGSAGHVGVLAAVLLTVAGTFDSTGAGDDVAVALVLVAVGAGWAALAWRLLDEPSLGLVLGAGTAFAGAQVASFGASPELGHALTAAVAVACFTGYLRLRDVGPLGVGVLAVTVVVPEALAAWTDGSLGSAGVLLAAGLALLGASAAGWRLRAA